MTKKESYFGIDVSIAADFTSYINRPIIMQIKEFAKAGKPVFAIDIATLITQYNIPESIFRDKRYRLVINPTLCVSPNDMIVYRRRTVGQRVAQVVMDMSRRKNPFFKQMIKCRQFDKKALRDKNPKVQSDYKYQMAAPIVHDLVINDATSRNYEQRSMMAEQLGGMIGKWIYDSIERRDMDSDISDFKSPFSKLIDNMKSNELTVGYKGQKYIGEAYKSVKQYKNDDDDYEVDTEEEKEQKESRSVEYIPIRHSSNDMRHDNQDGIDIVITPFVIASWLPTSMYCESTLYGIEELPSYKNETLRWKDIEPPAFTIDFHQRHIVRASMMLDDKVFPRDYKEESEDDSVWDVLYTSMGDSANLMSVDTVTSVARPEMEEVATKLIRRRQSGHYVNMDQILFPFRGVIGSNGNRIGVNIFSDEDIDLVSQVGRRIDVGDLGAAAQGLALLSLWYELYTIFDDRWDVWIKIMTEQGWPGSNGFQQLASSKNNELNVVAYAFGRWNDEQTTIQWTSGGDLNTKTAVIGSDLVRWSTDIGLFGISGHKIIVSLLPPHVLWGIMQTTRGFFSKDGAKQKKQVLGIAHHSGVTTRRLRRMTNFTSGHKQLFVDSEIVNPENFYKHYK